ncbi:MAG TPA: YfcE family phosphodiesterase [Gemmatimonadaceae bacterium]|nr:YfcE family phosphodiesterase [Gemmatimonadaceae bacterium]
MKIGLMADSHDRVPAIAELLKQMREAGATMVLHAGDYVSPFALKPFDDMHMTLQGVFGRNDGDHQGLLSTAGAGIGIEIFESPHSFDVGGNQILLVHDLGDVQKRSIKSHTFIVHGFAHQQSLKTQGDSILVNPGETCGWMYGTPGAAILDLDSKHVEFLTLKGEEWKF